MSLWNDLSSGTKIIIIIVVSFIVWLVTSYIMIRINYKPQFDWWITNGGTNYDEKFNLFALCTANYSTPLYYISKLFANPLNQLNIAQTSFVIGQLLPHIRYELDGKQYGLLTPKSLCETVKISRQDNDDTFNYWFDHSKKNGKFMKEDIVLKYTPDSPVKNGAGRDTYTYSLVDSGDNYGVYPGPTDQPSWCGLILEWLGDKGEWVMEKSEQDNMLRPIPKIGLQNSLGKWFANGGRGDNFLARMNILPDCPLVLFFCNNYYIVQGVKVDSQAFTNLLSPAGSLAGGWVGFLRGASSLDYDDYVSLLYSQLADKYAIIPPKPPCKNPDLTTGLVAGGISALSLLPMAFTPAGEVGAIALGCALLVGAGSGYQAGKGTCP